MAADPYKYFRIEAREILEDLGKGVLVLEKGQSTPELIARLLRLAHTLKGAARVVKQIEIAEHAHAIEDVLAPYREGAAVAPRDRVDAVLGLLDSMSARLAALSPPEEPAGVPVAQLEETSRALRADVHEVDALLEGVAEVNVPLAGMRRSVASLEQVRRMTELLSAQVASPRASAEAGALHLRSTVDEIRRAFALLERDLAFGIEQTDRELRQVRDAAERLRLLPAGAMFAFLERAVRDAAVALGKRVTFEATGGHVRLDGDVLGPIQSALLQAARNAVAHGIEPEADRVSGRKSPSGRVSIVVTRRGNRVVFACSDDGRGIDAQAVRRAAAQRGVNITNEQEHDPREIARLLLKGGISTSAAITGVSGRGVGLDVVREAASHLGGEVEIRTELRKGTTIEIAVPITLSALDVLLVEIEGERASIPLEKVRRTMRIRSADVTRNADGESISIEGLTIAFASLSRLLRLPASGVANATTSRGWSAILVESGGAMVAVGVDRLLGTQNVVLRSLPELVLADPIVAGGSLDAEGNPQIVLDTDALVRAVGRLEALQPTPKVAKIPILVVDDSLTTRMLEQSILESAGYEVDVAKSGEEGLERARERRYALFLVDVEMPGMDGFTFIQTTRADPTLKDIPGILVTSRAAPEDRRRGEMVGARAYIVKSEFEQTGLLNLIRGLVG